MDILSFNVYPCSGGLAICKSRSGATAWPCGCRRQWSRHLNLKEGDQVEIQVAGRNAFEVSKTPGRRELVARLRKFRGRLPATFRFDRLEANERG